MAIKTFLEFYEMREAEFLRESAPPWLIVAKYQQAIETLQNSKYFKGRPLPKEILLSREQLPIIFGEELPTLMKLGIVKYNGRNQDQVMVGATGSYAVVNPISWK